MDHQSADALRRGLPGYTQEFRLRDANGAIHWMHGDVRIQQLNKNQYEVIGLTRDITEYKQTEDALRESEERFRSLYENAFIGIYRTTPDGRILMANPAALRMLNFNSFEELASRNLERDGFEPVYSRKEFRERIERDGSITGWERTWIRKDGSTIYVRESTKAIRDENGKILYDDGTFEDITEIKRSEVALKDSEERFRKLVEGAPAAVIILSGTGEVRYANSMSLKLFGYKKVSDYLSLKMLDSIAPESRDLVIERFRLRAQGVSIPDQFEIVGLRTDGTKFPMHVAVSVIRLGNEDMTLNFISDITERRHAEELIRESEERFRILIECAPAAVIILSTTGEIRYANSMTIKMFGYRGEDDYHRLNILDYIAPESRKLITDRFRLHAQGVPLPNQYEIMGIRADGTRFPIHVAASHIQLRGEDLGLNFVNDISGLKRIEEALRESETKYRDMVEQISDVMFEIDINGKFTYISPAVEALGGYKQEDMLGHFIYEFLDPDFIPKIKEQFVKVIAGNLEPAEYRIKNKAGEYQWIRSSSRPILEERPACWYARCVNRDNCKETSGRIVNLLSHDY